MDQKMKFIKKKSEYLIMGSDRLNGYTRLRTVLDANQKRNVIKGQEIVL